MIKLITKTSLLTLFICCLALISKAQLGYTFSQYDIGTSVGFNQVHGNPETTTSTQSIHFNLTYNATPYTNFVFETQLGRLAGGDSLKTKSGMQFNNDFSAFLIRGQLQVGELIDYSNNPVYNALKNFYISAGFGFIVNRITSISRYSHQVPGFFTDGLDNSQEPFIPLRVGYEFKVFNMYNQPSFKVDIGYGYNLVLGDELDGFSTGNGHHDAYSQFTLGVKFAIGGALTSYRKQIQY